MKALKVETHSIAKGNRNDDFSAYYPILSSRVLCMVGDFTSDSPKDANQVLLNHVKHFVEKRVTTWREHLIPPQDILGLLGRHINKHLQEGRGGAKTTLCACVIDSYEHEVHILNIGDSGFGIANSQPFQLVRKGDTVGARDASGFLPLETNQFAIFKLPFPKGSKLLVFTDGLWENTAHYLKPNQVEALLGDIFKHDSLQAITEAFQKHILSQSNHRDDLTYLIAKEEPVAVSDSHNDAMSQAQLKAFIEQRVFEALERQEGARPIPPSPLEAEFLQVLKQTATGLQAMEKRLLENIRGENEQVHQQLAGQWQSTLAQLQDSIGRLAEEVKEQRLTFKARVGNAITDATRDLRQLRDLATLPDQLEETNHRLKAMETIHRQTNIGQLKDVNLGQVQRRLQTLEKRLATQPKGVASNIPDKDVVVARERPPENQKKWPPHRIWAAINSLGLIVLLVWLAVAGWKNSKTIQPPAEQLPTQTVSDSGSKQPVSGYALLLEKSRTASPAQPFTWPSDFANIRHPELLAYLLGKSPQTTQREFACLAKSLAKVKASISAAQNPNKVTKQVVVALEECQIAGLSQFPLNVRAGSSSPNGTKLYPWLSQYSQATSMYPPAQRVLDLWLQLHAKVKNIDGDFGKGSQKIFEAELGKTIDLNALNGLRTAISNWEQAPQAQQQALLAAVKTQAVQFFKEASASVLDQEVSALKTFLKEAQPQKENAGIFVETQTASQGSQKLILGFAQSLTPLGEWYLNQQPSSQQDAALLMAVLANRLGLEKTDGQATAITQVLDRFQGVSFATLLQQAKKVN